MTLIDGCFNVGISVPQVLLLDAIATAASAAYSTRKTRAAYAGSCLQVRRSTDNAVQDIGFANNLLDTGSLSGFIGVNSGFVSKWYDQSGNGLDLVQATLASQPQLVNAGTILTQNGNPSVNFFFGGATTFLANATAVSSFITAAAYTLLTGFSLTAFDAASNAENVPIFTDSGGFMGFGPAGFTAHTSDFNCYTFDTADRNAYKTIATATNYVAISKFIGSTSINNYINGGSPTTTVVTGNVGGVAGTVISGKGFSTGSLRGELLELFSFKSALASADLNTLGSGSSIGGGGNMATYAGSTWTAVP